MNSVLGQEIATCYQEQWVLGAPMIFERIQMVLENMDKSFVGLAFQETLKFLYLCSKSEGSLTPSKMVDLVWHEMILFTQFYGHFCEKNFGRMIHHLPDNDQKKNEKRYQLTLKMYSLFWGKIPEEIWGSCSNISPTNCGSCEAI